MEWRMTCHTMYEAYLLYWTKENALNLIGAFFVACLTEASTLPPILYEFGYVLPTDGTEGFHSLNSARVFLGILAYSNSFSYCIDFTCNW